MNTPLTWGLTRKEQLIEEIAHLVLQKLDESNHSHPDTELLEEGVKDWVKGALLAFSLLAPSKFADPSSAANLQGFINRMNNLEQTLDRQEAIPEEKAKILGGAALEYAQTNSQDIPQVIDLIVDMSAEFPELLHAAGYLENLVNLEHVAENFPRAEIFKDLGIDINNDTLTLYHGPYNEPIHTNDGTTVIRTKFYDDPTALTPFKKRTIRRSIHPSKDVWVFYLEGSPRRTTMEISKQSSGKYAGRWVLSVNSRKWNVANYTF